MIKDKILFVCCAGDKAQRFAQLTAVWQGMGQARLGSDAALLRKTLRIQDRGQAWVVIGPVQEEMDPINIASAIASDKTAGQVILVVSELTGSLQTRAEQAGIDQVLSLGDVERQVQKSQVELESIAGCDLPWKQDFSVSSLSLSEIVALNHSGQMKALESGQLQAAGTQGPQGFLSDPLEYELDEVDGLESPAPAQVSPRALQPALIKNKHAGLVISVLSGRGGVGKTTLCCALGAIASIWGMKVAMVDFDLCSGNMYSYFGLSSPADLAGLCKREQLHQEDYLKVGKRIGKKQDFRLYGGCSRPEMAEVVFPYAHNIIVTLSNNFDLVLIDTSTTLTEASAEAMQSSDKVLLVADQRAGSVCSLARLAKLAGRLGVAHARMVQVVNKADPKRKDRIFMEKLDAQTQPSHSFTVVQAGLELPELLSLGKADEIPTIENDFYLQVSHLLAKLLSGQGRLPDVPKAAKALENPSTKRGFGFFRKGERESA